MSSTSAIEWTEVTWNPTTGCDRVSAGCDNCYAMTLAKRLKAMGQARYQNDGDPRTSGPGFGLTLHPESLELPYHWRKPRIVFVNSMSDLFHARVPADYLRQVLKVMWDNPHHTFQMLTKRSVRMRRLSPELDWPPNLWMGVTVESADQLGRINDLKQTGASVRFLSCEPLIGPLTAAPLEGIDWVIAGGESGPRARPIDPEWVRELRENCLENRVSFFFKQWGGRTPKANGRILDGRTWNEMPALATPA